MLTSRRTFLHSCPAYGVKNEPHLQLCEHRVMPTPHFSTRLTAFFHISQGEELQSCFFTNVDRRKQNAGSLSNMSTMWQLVKQEQIE